MSRSASAAPRSPATVEKRTKRSVFLPTFEKILALVYLLMSWVTVKVPKAPEPLACMRRSGITSRSKWASFSRYQTSCSSAGPRGPAVMMFWLSTTGAPALVVSFFFWLIVLLPVWTVFGGGALPAGARGGDHPEAVEEPQRPIHGVDRHRRNPRPDPPEDGFRIGMLRAPGDLAQNLGARVRELHARLLAGGLEPLEPPPHLDAVSFQGYAPICILYLDRNIAASMRPVKERGGLQRTSRRKRRAAQTGRSDGVRLPGWTIRQNPCRRSRAWRRDIAPGRLPRPPLRIGEHVLYNIFRMHIDASAC